MASNGINVWFCVCLNANQLFPLQCTFEISTSAKPEQPTASACEQAARQVSGHRRDGGKKRDQSHGYEPENALNPIEAQLKFARTSFHTRHGILDSLWRA